MLKELAYKMLQMLFAFFSRQKRTPNMETDHQNKWIPALKWCPTSVSDLEEAERKLFSFLKKPHAVEYVKIPSETADEDYKIRTIKVNEGKKETPLVLLHGFASGIGLWVLNLDSLAENRPVYAIDILGFGLSSRPKFSNDIKEIEQKFIKSIEQWRQSVGLKKFILLGHSFGGYLATAYTIQYSDPVKHLILADPWGFPADNMIVTKVQIPLWVRAVANVMQFFNPLAVLRAAGPWGPNLVEKFRPDIMQKYIPLVGSTEIIADYIYHCNAQIPSGEVAFKSLTLKFGWAKSPMIHRVGYLPEGLPVSFIYGSRSWINSDSGKKVRETLKNNLVEIHTIRGAGHHVYGDNAKAFNALMNDICLKDDASRESAVKKVPGVLNSVEEEYVLDSVSS